jgi:glycosyltransferase involved in cell wall biosynthesis
VDFVVYEGTPPGDHHAALEALGCRMIAALEFPSRGRAPFRLWSTLRAHGPYDVVHGHLHLANGWIVRVAALAGVPVRIAHSHFDGLTGAEPTRTRQAYQRLMRHWIRRYATLRVGVAEAAAADLFGERWQDNPATRVLRCGIDLEPFTTPADRVQLRAALGLPEGALVLGHAGRFEHQKNHIKLIEILACAFALEPRARALLLGQGPLQDACRDQARALGIAERIVFAGNRDDVPALMTGAMDAVVFPSLFEGLPIALLEAQAAGLPCIYADTITPEVEVVPALMTRLPLQAPPDVWAERVLAAIRARPQAPDEARAQFLASPFNITNSVEVFSRIYAGEPLGNGAVGGRSRR